MADRTQKYLEIANMLIELGVDSLDEAFEKGLISREEYDDFSKDVKI